MKRILTMQDIACFGKCSTTLALPILSVLGVETVILPTALFSTHTMFKDYTKKDLLEQIPSILTHWKKEGISFDGIYIGYLGSLEAVDMALEVIREFRSPDTLVFFDPAMGDRGRLYSGLDGTYAARMASICGMADYIFPNLTEACIITGEEYKEAQDESYLLNVIRRLSELFPNTVVSVTGVSPTQDQIGVMGMYGSGEGVSYKAQGKEDRDENRDIDRGREKAVDKDRTAYGVGEAAVLPTSESRKEKLSPFFSVMNERAPVSFHGTGDVLASVCIGAFLRGLSWEEALKKAVDYVYRTMLATIEDNRDPRYGLSFERTLSSLIMERDVDKKEE